MPPGPPMPPDSAACASHAACAAPAACAAHAGGSKKKIQFVKIQTTTPLPSPGADGDPMAMKEKGF